MGEFNADAWDKKNKYKRQAGAARQRGIEFKLTFDEWWHVWESSGHWEQRGTGIDQYCMVRNRGQGAFELGNVIIVTNRQNGQLAAAGWDFGRKKRTGPVPT